MQTRNLIASFTLGITLAAIPVLQSHASQENTPDLYSFTGYNSTGEKISINYSTTSFIGKPSFQYKDQKQTLNFAGDEIRTVETEIGTLVTVTIKKTVTIQKTEDGDYTTFSLLIPRIKIGIGEEVKVVTNGITTFNRFSTIPQLNQQQKQIYTIINLKGTAQFVLF
ncbi:MULTISPECIES: hypothetical protein [unclassified Nostoc]|uniref:hypothetical protein n=1 Tax=unclassified Nostoc TaxID=2593658 RepID=UPI002614E1C1|nr:hypothetical protein [Nostoc sp. S13]MDF5739576.1 hypothetical protein [Nostoc sp. S13]